MKIYRLIIFVSFSFLLAGCLTFHKISYELILDDELKGTGIITVFDIRSDAETDDEFEEDKNTLFGYILKDKQFITDMTDEGKDITSRRIFTKDNLLNGEAKFNFNDIRDVEGIAYEDGFYYLTMDLQDSIYSTNGQIVFSEEYKRIIWGKDTKTISFEMIATDFDDMYYRELAPYFKED
jgi:hypothetical protein